MIAVDKKHEPIFFEPPPGGATVFDMGRGPDVTREQQDIAAFELRGRGEFQMKIGAKGDLRHPTRHAFLGHPIKVVCKL